MSATLSRRCVDVVNKKHTRETFSLTNGGFAFCISSTSVPETKVGCTCVVTTRVHTMAGQWPVGPLLGQDRTCTGIKHGETLALRASTRASVNALDLLVAISDT